MDRHRCSECGESFRTHPQLRGHYSMAHRFDGKVSGSGE